MAEVYGERVAPIAYYTNTAAPFYTAEGYARWHTYPPPYLYGGSYVYAWPWLWLDGCPDPGYSYSSWESFLLDRLPVPSDVALDLSGTYDGSTRTGSITIALHSEGAGSLSGTVHCVLTESELYYVAPNTLEWHHFVMRDKLPTQTGTPVTLGPGEQAILTLPFQLQATWVEAECDVVCFFQDTVFQPDNTLEIWQGAKIPIPELMDPAAVGGPGENRGPAGPALVLYPAQPNPGRPQTEIAFELQQGCDVRLAIYDTAGRCVATLLEGRRDAGRHAVTWAGVTETGGEAPAGVYFCRLEAASTRQTQRLLIAR